VGTREWDDEAIIQQLLAIKFSSIFWIDSIMKLLTIFANDNIVYEHDRDKVLDERQIAFLDKMDGDMDRGIKIQGELITHPDTKQRATFVAMNLLKALKQENNAIIAASCTYLAQRLPALIEVRAKDQGDGLTIELVEEH
jgi:hypothetical protein